MPCRGILAVEKLRSRTTYSGTGNDSTGDPVRVSGALCREGPAGYRHILYSPKVQLIYLTKVVRVCWVRVLHLIAEGGDCLWQMVAW